MSAWRGDDDRRADQQGPWAGLRWGSLLSTACRSHVSAATLASPTQSLDRGLVAVPAHICKRHGVLSPCTGRTQSNLNRWRGSLQHEKQNKGRVPATGP